MTETTQTETVRETVVTPEPVVAVDAGTVVPAEGEQVTESATVEVTDGDTSLSATADSPVALSVAVVLGLLVVAALAVKKLLNK